MYTGISVFTLADGLSYTPSTLPSEPNCFLSPHLPTLRGIIRQFGSLGTDGMFSLFLRIGNNNELPRIATLGVVMREIAPAARAYRAITDQSSGNTPSVPGFPSPVSPGFLIIRKRPVGPERAKFGKGWASP